MAASVSAYRLEIPFIQLSALTILQKMLCNNQRIPPGNNNHCRQAINNKTKETNKSLLRCQQRQSRRRDWLSKEYTENPYYGHKTLTHRMESTKAGAHKILQKVLKISQFFDLVDIVF